MSTAYYIVLNNEDPGFETFVNGKAIAHSLEQLDALCEQNRLPKLESFCGQSMDELADLLDQDIEIPAGSDPGPQWFEPRDGIALVDSLMQVIRQQPDAIPTSDFASQAEVLEDLAEYRNVLTQAEEIGAKWHLALDF